MLTRACLFVLQDLRDGNRQSLLVLTPRQRRRDAEHRNPGVPFRTKSLERQALARPLLTDSVGELAVFAACIAYVALLIGRQAARGIDGLTVDLQPGAKGLESAHHVLWVHARRIRATDDNEVAIPAHDVDEFVDQSRWRTE